MRGQQCRSSTNESGGYLSVRVEESDQPVLVIAGDTIFSQHFRLDSFIDTWIQLQGTEKHPTVCTTSYWSKVFNNSFEK